jgi:hypothetical protein
MSHLIHAFSKAAAAADPHPAKVDLAASPSSAPLGRPDSLTAQRIQVGLVLKAMLGASAASDYFARQAVNTKIAQRVLSESGRRRRDDNDVPLG